MKHDTTEQITAKEWVLKDVATITEAETEREKEYWKDLEKDGWTSYKFCTGTDQEDWCVRTEEL